MIAYARSLNLSRKYLVSTPVCAVARAFCPLLILTIFATAVAAETLDNYHRRVQQAVTALDTLAQQDESEDLMTYNTRVANTFAQVRTTLPQTETVEWKGGTFSVDQRWLHQSLDQYGQASGQERPQKLRLISEQLQAIEERLKEIETASEHGPDKETARQRLSEILSRSEYAKNAPEKNALAKLISDILKWLDNLFPKPKALSPGRANLFTLIAQIFVVMLALAVLAYVIKVFAPRLLRGRGSKKQSKSEPRIVLGETLQPDQSAGDLLAEAEALARQGELRAAIRKAYIALLVEMGERKLISLAQHKTNRDYLRAVRSHEPLYGNLKGLTDSFERHWYGFAKATEDDWTAFRAGYKKALSH